MHDISSYINISWPNFYFFNIIFIITLGIALLELYNLAALDLSLSKSWKQSFLYGYKTCNSYILIGPLMGLFLVKLVQWNILVPRDLK